jgi:oxygen-independent coproporphyrinogen-3 oxidase
MYELTGEYLAAQGYHRYEISNYAREGRECRHNCVYWMGGEYLGVGVQASSYLYGYRFTAPGQMQQYEQYIAAVEQGIFVTGAGSCQMRERAKSLLCDVETPDKKRQMEEFMFLGLRMSRGISPVTFREKFGTDIRAVYGDVLDTLVSKQLLEYKERGERICLTPRGIDVSNPVLAMFLLDE